MNVYIFYVHDLDDLSVDDPEYLSCNGKFGSRLSRSLFFPI